MLPILMYHRIGVATPATPPMSRRLTVHPMLFAAHMRWLADHGYRTVTQREILWAFVCGHPLGPKPVLITFDDGYRDVFLRASPVLLRLGLHATAYVIVGRVSRGDPAFLTWSDLRALEARGLEIGSHTMSHLDLVTLSDDHARRELVGSRRLLERRLGHPVPWLAYPFGAFDARVEGLARRAGYSLAVTTQHGVVQQSVRPLALLRLHVLDSTSVPELATMLEAAGPTG